MASLRTALVRSWVVSPLGRGIVPPLARGPTRHFKHAGAGLRRFSAHSPVEQVKPVRQFPCVDHMEERSRQLLAAQDQHSLIVQPPPGHAVFQHRQPFLCDYGGLLPGFDMAYEIWGELNADRDNAILIHTGLSASSHAKSHAENSTPGWWEKFIGPGCAIDTNKFFVICTNVLGGCYGSTGPSSVNPVTQRRFATDFPVLSLHDMVRAQFLLLDSLQISTLHASVGASMGGMQSIAAAAMYPERVSRLVSISACARSHPYSIAMRHVQRQVLMSDPHWQKGHYYDGVLPHAGMKLAREIATISYRSGPEWEKRFGRKRRNFYHQPEFCPDFEIETYLDHQGEKFCLQYDPNSLLYISKAMDLFDMSAPALGDLILRREAARQTYQAHGHTLPNDDPAHIPYKAVRGTLDLSAVQPAAHPLYGLELNGVDSSSAEACSSSTPLASHIQHMPTPPAIEDGYTEEQHLVHGLSSIQIPTLVLGVKSDILFPVWQQQEIARAIRKSGNQRVVYYELDAMYGHDTFLIDLPNIGAAVKGHLENAL
ncbi:homoserine O-acetyltransferase [Dimargaris verticillata]|uniref:Homoserine O-acetyltransferase n=1 Tax=Dimargaris verticillata TaxID=2761393 RepID=A0A9W8B3P2_9FUNG|nr:homoserine O-acetyltransferase [Dimargaris verticillata]